MKERELKLNNLNDRKRNNREEKNKINASAMIYILDI